MVESNHKLCVVPSPCMADSIIILPHCIQQLPKTLEIAQAASWGIRVAVQL